jgi:predicted dehydrogenase
MRFGILGTSTIARREHVDAVRRAGHDVTAVASRSTERAERMAGDLSVPEAYGSYGALLGDSDVDAVVNTLPNSEHAPWSRRAADEGLHVLCEKPLATSAAEARETGAHCDDAGVVLMEGLMYRYHPRVERLGVLVPDVVGEPTGVSAVFHNSLSGWPVPPRLDPDLGGGSVMDLGAYAVDAVNYLLGEPETVVARSSDSRNSGVDTSTSAVLTYPNGTHATITTSFEGQYHQHLHVEGSEGWLRADPAFPAGDDEETTIEYSLGEREAVERFPPADYFRRQVEHFVDRVASGGTPRTDASNAADYLTIVDAIRESADSGELVSLA